METLHLKFPCTQSRGGLLGANLRVLKQNVRLHLSLRHTEVVLATQGPRLSSSVVILANRVDGLSIQGFGESFNETMKVTCQTVFKGI